MTTENEKEGSDSAPRSASPLRRVGTAGLAFINPASDLVVLYRKAFKPTAVRVYELGGLVKGLVRRPAKSGEALTWDAAVQRTGRSVTQLHNQLVQWRLAWWLLMAFCGALALLLLLMILAAYTSLPAGTLIRALATLVFLVAASSLGFVKALEKTYRLWQLKLQRVSVEEGGTFQDFLVETRWIAQTLRLGHFGK